jgi:hypothetical protein
MSGIDLRACLINVKKTILPFVLTALIIVPTVDAQHFTLELRGGTSVEARSRNTIDLVVIRQSADTVELPPFRCVVRFDTVCGRYWSFQASRVYLLYGTPYSLTRSDSEITLTTTDTIRIRQSGSLFAVTFTTGDPDVDHQANIRVAEWTFADSLPVPRLPSLAFNVYPYRLFFTGCDDRSGSFNWDIPKDRYDPDSLWMYGYAVNHRADTARNVEFTVAYDTSALELVWPDRSTQFSTPRDIPPGASGQCRWGFRAKPRWDHYSTNVIDTITSDNFQRHACVNTVTVGRVTTTLKLGVRLPVVRYDVMLRRYSPLPIPIDVTVSNTGFRRSDTVAVPLEIPEYLSFTGKPGATVDTIRMVPAVLEAGQEATARVFLQTALSGSPRRAALYATLTNENSARVDDTVYLPIPPASYPAFLPLCTYPDSLKYNAVAEAVTPNVFPVRARFVNTGTAAAVNAEAALILPPRFRLLSPLDSVQRLLPAIIHPGDTTNEREWMVRYSGVERSSSLFQFGWKIRGRHEAGDSLSLMEFGCGHGAIEGLPPVFSCTLVSPDTVILQPGTTGTRSTDLPITCLVANISRREQTMHAIQFLIHPRVVSGGWQYEQDLWLDDPAEGERQPDTAIAPGDTAVFTSHLRIDYRTLRQSTTLATAVVDGEGNRTESAKWLRLEKVRSASFALKRILVDWPMTELYLEASCDGIAFDSYDTSFVSVRENGRDVRGLEVYCPARAWRCPMSVALAAAVRADQAESGRVLARAIIEQMDGVSDEAAIFSKSPAVPMIHDFTTAKDSLIASLSGFGQPVFGGLSDAVYDCLLQLETRAKNWCKGVIVLTDGSDEGGIHTLREAIDYARKLWIPVVVVVLGSPTREADLRRLADATWDGMYLKNPPMSSMPTVIDNIAWTSYLWENCAVFYSNDCADGSTRDVTLTLRGACPGNDSIVVLSGSYTARIVQEAFRSLNLAMEPVTTVEDSACIVPLVLGTLMTEDTLRAARFSLVFDSSLLHFDSISTVGSLLAGAKVGILRHGDTIAIETPARYFKAAMGALLTLHFHAHSVSTTTSTMIRCIAWNFVHGCYTPALTDGRVIIIPRSVEALETFPCSEDFSLDQSYPNPASSSTEAALRFTLAEAARVRLVVTNAAGEEVAVIVDGYRERGPHVERFRPSALPPGTYYYTLTSSRRSGTKRMVVIR